MTVRFVSLGERTDHYTFSANTLSEALDNMLRRGPRDGDGHHSASCDMRADIMPGLQPGIVAGSTRQAQGMPGWTSTAHIDQGILRYGFIFRFPRWTNFESLSRPIQAEWRRYRRCLWSHERGHVQTTTPILYRYLRRFRNLEIMSQGGSRGGAEQTARRELRENVQDLYNQLAFRNQQANNEYDRRTRHGRNQGARLHTGIRRSSRQ